MTLSEARGVRRPIGVSGATATERPARAGGGGVLAGGTTPYRLPSGYGLVKAFVLLFVGTLVAGILLTLGVTLTFVVAWTVLYAVGSLVYGVSPLLTPHTLNDRELVIRHGWYFRATIPVDRIDRVEPYDGVVPARGVVFLGGGRRLFVTPSREGALRLVFTRPLRLRGALLPEVDEAVLSVDEPDRFQRDLEALLPRHPGSSTVAAGDASCPSCGQSLAIEAPAGSAARAGRGARGTRAILDGAPEGRADPGAGTPSHRVEAMFLIHRDGRLITPFSAGFNPHGAMSISGMLTVVQDFLQDAFKAEGEGLRTLAQGDLTVVVEGGRSAYLAVVIQGPEDPRLRDGMRRAVAEIHQLYGARLAAWDGDLGPLEGVKRVMSQVLWL